MYGLLGTALIGGVFGFLQARISGGRGGGEPSAARRTTQHHKALETFLIAHGFDPRKVRTGYETMDEVRRATE